MNFLIIIILLLFTGTSFANEKEIENYRLEIDSMFQKIRNSVIMNNDSFKFTGKIPVKLEGSMSSIVYIFDNNHNLVLHDRDKINITHEIKRDKFIIETIISKDGGNLVGKNIVNLYPGGMEAQVSNETGTVLHETKCQTDRNFILYDKTFEANKIYEVHYVCHSGVNIIKQVYQYSYIGLYTEKSQSYHVISVDNKTDITCTKTEQQCIEQFSFSKGLLMFHFNSSKLSKIILNTDRQEPENRTFSYHRTDY